jgi:hypothetical protein
MQAMPISLEDIVVKNLNCVAEGLSSRNEALAEIMEYVNKNFISYDNLGNINQLKLGQIKQLKEVSGFEIKQENLVLSFTKQIPIVIRRS